ncbi:MAG: sigma-70 family RNA polymerase sigma factor [Chitinophagales bacterium]
MSDEEIVAEIVRTQSATLVEVLYERYADKVFRKCISFVKEESIASDLTHDIFIKVYMKLASFKGNSRFSTWLYSITYNFCVDYTRKNSKTKTVSIDDEERVKNIEVESVDDFAHIKATRLKVLLEKIKPEERMILLMKYKDDMSIKDIQEVLKVSESAVKMRLKRAKEKVHELYKNTYAENYM